MCLIFFVNMRCTKAQTWYFIQINHIYFTVREKVVSIKNRMLALSEFEM
jgi:hypothetical protein